MDLRSLPDATAPTADTAASPTATMKCLGSPALGRRQPAKQATLDIVIPLFNEQAIVEQLHQRVVAACRSLPLDCRILYVDDGSSDETVARLKRLAGESPCPVEIICLVRNFGQPAAILAGMSQADADAIVLMDGDLQDPPELIPQLVAEWQAGHRVVIPQRPRRKETSWLRGWAFKTFHRLFQGLSELSIPDNCGTFCLLSRDVAREIVELPEVHRFFPGLRAWVGGPPRLISYERPPRAGGEPKQTFSRLLRYAGDGILGFSRKPALWLLKAGLVLLGGSLLLAAAGAVAWLGSLPGVWLLIGASALVFLSGLQLACCGFLGDLLLRIQEQLKQRPAYLIGERVSNRTVSEQHRQVA